MRNVFSVGVTVAVAAGAAVSIGLANPVGPVVQAGNATFQGGPGVLTINQTTPRSIINWQGFSIDRGEVTRFAQPGVDAAVLNRVVTANPSAIHVSLQANGRVYLINPNGILVGPGGQIQVGQFIGSRATSPTRLSPGRSPPVLRDSAAAIRNEGRIQALQGNVYLAARTVENAGTLSAPQGTVGVAAGNEIVLHELGEEGISVVAARETSPSGTGIDNAGMIEGVKAELAAAGGNIYALSMNNRGTIRTTSVTRENGMIVIKGGGGNIENSGILSARNADGSGGTIQIEAGHNAESPATVLYSGVADARGEGAGNRGGAVQITGDRVALTEDGSVDVSGPAGGGVALVGGGYQGRNPVVQKRSGHPCWSQREHPRGCIGGRGWGQVVVWSDGTTWFLARFPPKGGRRGVTADWWRLRKSRACHCREPGAGWRAAGRGGTWLLDPSDITIDQDFANALNASLNEVRVRLYKRTQAVLETVISLSQRRSQKTLAHPTPP